MFVGRNEELEKLKKLSGLNKASLVICRGRRRIGKSTLIEKFAESYSNFYEFQGLAPRDSINNSDQLENFSRMFSDQFDLPLLKFQSWYQAFSLLAKQTEKQKALIFLDEISWLAANDKDFLGQLKIAWDLKFKKNKKLMLVICGSVSSWIDNNILNSADFVGRVSLTISLEELALPFCNEFWGKRKQRISSKEKIRLLSITGGVPKYLEEIDYRSSAEDNIKRLCFDESGILFSEFEKIFNDIFSKKAGTYKEIVKSLVNGRKSFSEICQVIGVEPSGVTSKYLEDLEASGFIKRDYVYSIKSGVKGKLSKYRLKDNYIRFYLKYIDPLKDRIEQGLFRYKSIENLDSYDSIMGLQFENLVLNNLPAVIKKTGISPDNIISASPYYQNKTQRTEACQIDLLIHTTYTLYICEIKFRNIIDKTIIKEVSTKASKLKYSKNLSIRPILIYCGDLSPTLSEENFFDKIINFEELLEE